MSGAVLTYRGLSDLAGRLRRLFSGGDDEDLPCTCMFENKPSAEPPAMGARERRWAATKLLRPIDKATSEDLRDLSAEEVQQFHEEYWALVVEHGAEKDPAARYQRVARQFSHTRAFACAVWGIGDFAPEDPEPEEAYDPSSIEVLDGMSRRDAEEDQGDAEWEAIVDEIDDLFNADEIPGDD